MVNITHARINKGLKMAELAELVGVSPAAISQWESGEKTPRRENLERLAAALDVTTEYLTGKEEKPQGFPRGLSNDFLLVIMDLDMEELALLQHIVNSRILQLKKGADKEAQK